MIEIFSFLLSFLFFAADVGLDLFRVQSVGSLEVSTSSTKGGVSMVVSVVISLEISMASRTGAERSSLELIGIWGTYLLVS